MNRVITLIAASGAPRLDRFISEQRPELSRSHAQKLIDGDRVTVNGRAAKASLRLNPGDRVEIDLPPPSPSPLAPEAIPLTILYEDDDVLVIDKPAGMTVHPAPGHPEHTLVNAVLAHFPALAEVGTTRPGIVHRLDKDTSGVMLVAKNAAAQANLVAQFKSRSVVKVYQVLVQGHLTPAHGSIEADIGRDSSDRKRMAVVSRGRAARTDYRVVRYAGPHTLVEATLHTGRTHQIRVHFGAIGFPVVGDPTYGVKSPHLARQFLHASRLGFKLPSTARYVEYNSPLPPDLAEALRHAES